MLGGMPYTWTALGSPRRFLELRQRANLLAWSGIMALFLILLSISEAIGMYFRALGLNQDIHRSILLINDLLKLSSPVVLLLYAFRKADKMANILRLFSVVQNQTRDIPRTSRKHLDVFISLIGTVLSSLTASVLVSNYLQKQISSPFQLVVFILQDAIFNTVLTLMVAILTTLLLEMSDLAECVTTRLVGFKTSRRAINILTPFSDTWTSYGHRCFMANINAKLIPWAEKSLKALNEAARESEVYLQIPALFIAAGFVNILFICYNMTVNPKVFPPVSFVLLASHFSRLWCAMHAADIYRNKVSFVCQEKKIHHLIQALLFPYRTMIFNNVDLSVLEQML